MSRFIPLLVVFFLVQPAFSQHVITIHFEDLKSDKGEIMIALLDENGKEVQQKIVKAEKPVTTVKLDPVSKGRYAIKTFQDENSNSELDTGTFGIPKEPYGFSNNARGTFGPPDLEDQLFTVDKHVTQHITLK